MTQPLVSVVVPVFDCRDAVRRTLESVFAQTLPAAQIETIAVDDGSTDGDAELLDELARAHDRLTVRRNGCGCEPMHPLSSAAMWK